MKRVLIITILCITSLSNSWAQDDAISRFFKSYAEDPDFTVVTVTKRMFGLFANIEEGDPNMKEAMDAISKIDGLRVLALEDDSIRAPKLYKEAKTKIPVNEYDELMTIRNKDGMNLSFVIKEANGIIAELLMIGGGADDFFIMSLVGEIDLNQISKLSGAMNIDGFKNLELLDDRKKN